MKTLYVIRHAKSSWDDISLDDFDRPLNDRGKTDAPRMGKRLKEKNIHPGLILSSPAKRAFCTAKRISEVLGYPKDNIKTDRALYHAASTQIFSVIKNLPDKFDNLMIFGHNPGLTDFVNDAGEATNIDNIPTCGVVAFEFDIDSWSRVSAGLGKLLFFDYPKSKKD